MFWVLQDRFFDPHAFAELRRQLDAQAAPHAVVRVNARTLEVDPPVGPEGAVFVCGSSTLGRVAKARGWWPGYVDDNLDYRLLAHHYGGHLLNADAACVPLDEASPPAGPVFVRPVGDGKQFAGRRRRYPRRAQGGGDQCDRIERVLRRRYRPVRRRDRSHGAVPGVSRAGSPRPPRGPFMRPPIRHQLPILSLL